jgi:hypothetical protein
MTRPVFGQTPSPAEVERAKRQRERDEQAKRAAEIPAEWKAWAANVTAACADLAAPCPTCGLHLGEPGTTCGYCFICHGRDHCGCDEKGLA